MDIQNKQKNDKLLDLKISRRITLFLVLMQPFLIVVFTILKIYLMAYVDGAVLAIYIINMLCNKKNIILNIYITASLIYAHIIMAMLSMGWRAGFQLYFFALIFLLFYTDYMFKCSGQKTVHPGILAVANVVVYIFMRIWTAFNKPVYTNISVFDQELFYVANTAIVFTVIIVFLWNFERIIIRTEDTLTDLANKDTLTGLNNRRSITKFMDEFFNDNDEESTDGSDGTETKEKEQLAVAIIDIDDFKLINDRYGHNAGDYVLKQVAEEIIAIEDEETITCRWGGEEFLFIRTGENPYDKLNEAIRKMALAIIKKKMEYGGNLINVTVTAGCTLRHDNENIDKSIERADQYLYFGKQNGKNRVISQA